MKARQMKTSQMKTSQMKTSQMKARQLSQSEMKAFDPDNKIGILATLDPNNLPHLSLITTLKARSPKQLMFGQFCEGESKRNVQERPKTGFVVMTMDRKIWRGQARWTDKTGHGEDYERLNQAPMFRYNAYFGIHTVHHMELERLGEPEGLSLAGLGAGILLSTAARALTRAPRKEPILSPWAKRLISRPDTLKFLSWVGEDGYPELVPVVPCTAPDRRRLLFSPTVYRCLLKKLQPDQPLCVFAVNLAMESVCVRGTFRGYGGGLKLGAGLVDLDWVYNSMPPKQGQIYPPQPTKPVTDFQGEMS